MWVQIPASPKNYMEKDVLLHGREYIENNKDSQIGKLHQNFFLSQNQKCYDFKISSSVPKNLSFLALNFNDKPTLLVHRLY
jgi:hypothetical protein